MQQKRYRKIPKISPGAYIFQKPFLKGLFLEGLIFGGAYLRREICVSKSIGLAYIWKWIYHFCFVLLRIWEQFSKYKPPGGVYLEGLFNGGFFALPVWGGLIFGGAFTWRGLFSEFYGSLFTGEKFLRMLCKKWHVIDFGQCHWLRGKNTREMLLRGKKRWQLFIAVTALKFLAIVRHQKFIWSKFWRKCVL